MSPHAVDSDGYPNSTAAVMPADVVTVLGYTRNLTRQQVDYHHGNGRGVGLIFEYAPNDPLRGSAWGDQDAHHFVQQANALGAPAGVAGWFTADVDVPRSAWPAVLAYCQTAGPIVHAAGYRLGLYAGEDVADYLLDVGAIDLAWGVAASSWSHGHRSGRVVLRQLLAQPRYGVVCDLNDVLADDHGQWSPTAPQRPPAQETENMVFIYRNTDSDDPSSDLFAWLPGTYALRVQPVHAQEALNAGRVLGGAYLDRPWSFIAPLIDPTRGPV